MVCIAALQLRAPSDFDASLGECERLVARAAQRGAAIVVCPALSARECVDERAPEAAPEARAEARLGALAREHGLWLVYAIESHSQRTQSAIDPTGAVVGRATTADAEPRFSIVSTPHGAIGLSAELFTIPASTSRKLAQGGALLLCLSLGSCSPAATQLRAAARASESRVWVAVAGTSVRPQDPYPSSQETLPPELLSSEGGLPLEEPVCLLFGPLGDRLGTVHDDLTTAELDLASDGAGWAERRAERLGLCRPALYARGPGRAPRWGLAPLEAALIATVEPPASASFAQALSDARAYLEPLSERGVKLAILPELFCFDQERSDRDLSAVVRALAESCRDTDMHVVTSLVERGAEGTFHLGVLIGQRGLVMRQRQLHLSSRYVWAQRGQRVETAALPWGRLALAIGDDLLVPELFETFGALGVDLVAGCGSLAEVSDADRVLPALADEYRLVVAAQIRADDAQGGVHGASLIIDPTHWPAQRALQGQRVIQKAIYLRRRGVAPDAHASESWG